MLSGIKMSDPLMSLHQETTREIDSDKVEKLSLNMDLKSLLKLAKDQDTDELQLVDVTQSGPGRTRIDAIDVTVTGMRELCLGGELWNPKTLECVKPDKHHHHHHHR